MCEGGGAPRYPLHYTMRVKGFWRKVRKLLGFYGGKYDRNLTVSRNLRQRTVGRAVLLRH